MARRTPAVLVLIKGLGIGGAEKLIAEGAALWDRARFDYRVAYVLPWKNQLVGEIEALDIPVTCLGEPRGNSVVASKRLRRLVRDWEIDIIHAHLPVTGILARSTNLPVVYTEHNLADSYRQPTRALNRLTYRRNRTVLAVSDAVATSLAGYPAKSMQVVPNGVKVDVDPAAVAGVRAELSLTQQDPLVVHIGNVRPHKGHATLIAAAAELHKVRPDVTVVSIGAEKHPGELAQFRSQAANLGLGDSLRFLGHRSDALSFAAAADVYVNPADVEGLPVSILEALALGVPVVATDVGGVSTAVRDEVSGLLVKPRDPVALADGIARLLDDPPFAKQLGREAKNLVEREFGLETMVRSVEKVYEQVLLG